MSDLIEFETQRLRLRQWRSSDREPFARMNADRRVMEFFPSPLDRAESDALAERIERLIAEHGWGLWAVETLHAKQFIGFVGLHHLSADLPFAPGVEIGWRLASEHWGQGYALEAARAALRAGFEKLGLPEIVAFTALQNLRSRALMEQLGMRNSGENFLHPRLAADSPLREHCLYRLSREGRIDQLIPI